MNNPVYQGLFWALTDAAKEEVTKLVSKGVDYDLAFSLLDNQVREGALQESDVYCLPTTNMPDECNESGKFYLLEEVKREVTRTAK